jgi:alkylhydroperoxidase/carboxymuconolactone decarboxylase family protein YurZ
MIYLGIALATGSAGCIEAMLNKARTEGISKEKLLEVYKIARFAEASRVFAGTADMFAKLEAEW